MWCKWFTSVFLESECVCVPLAPTLWTTPLRGDRILIYLRPSDELTQESSVKQEVSIGNEIPRLEPQTKGVEP